MAEPPVSSPSAITGAPDEKARARARVGRTINGKWQLDALLGVGGMASVYAATHHRNGSRAALKILHPEFGRDAGIRDRFLREGKVANKVEHRGRVMILDDDVTEQDEPFLVMELLEGETVQQLWKRKARRVPVLEALAIMEQVLDALESFHAMSIIHRDLKPANIFITRDETVKLLDFGVARMRDAEGGLTRAGTALGTPSFMAPEQAMGLTDGIDGRADIFSVGATLYAILGGQRLHQGRSDNEAFILAATHPAPSLARTAPELPVEVIGLVDKALAWDPRNRFDSATIMRTEVLRLLEALGGGPKHETQPPNRRSYTGPSSPQPPEAPEEEQPEQDAEPNDAAVLRLVDMFRRIDRLLPTVRQYGWEHPESDNKLRAAFQGVIDALRGGAGSVFWTLRPYSFMHRSQTVWEPTHPFDVVPYHLFAAGVRGIQIVPGITEEELRTLCEVMLIDPARDLTPEDDVASALWEKRLEHVTYQVINAFAEGDAADRENFYEEVDSIEDLARRASEQRANIAEAAAMAIETDGAALKAARSAAAVLGLDPVAKKALGAQLSMNAERWSERFVDVLADAFVDARRRGDVTLITEPLDASVRDMLLAHRFEVIFSMHDALTKAIDAAMPPSDSPTLRAELTQGMFTPETLRMIVREATRFQLGQAALTSPSSQLRPIDVDALALGLGPVMMELGASHLEAVMDIVGGVTHDGLRRVLFGYLESALPGREGLVVDRLMTLDVETARPILKILAAIKSQSAIDALRRLAGCVNANLRCEAIAHLSQSPEQLRDELTQLCDNPQPEVRSAALRTLAFHQVRSAGPVLVRRVQDPSFHQLALDERRELFNALSSLNASRAEAIAIEIVGKHGLLVDEAVEQTRAICADLLGREARSIEALEAVLTAAKRRFWNSAPLRDAATAAAENIAARLGKRITPGGEVQ